MIGNWIIVKINGIWMPGSHQSKLSWIRLFMTILMS